MDQSLVRDKYFILLEKTRGYTLEPHVFEPPKKVLRKELQRGTIMEERTSKDPQRKTFVVAHQNELHLDCRNESLANKLTKLTDKEAERLLKISSLEKRYQSFVSHRSEYQHKAGGEVSK